MLTKIVDRFFGKLESQVRFEQDDVLLATCALLMEIAAVDGEFSSDERETILEILQRDHGLDAAAAEELMAMAEAERQRSVDLWSFTSRLNRSLDRDGKLAVIMKIWEVIYADKRLDGYEDYLVHKLADLLNLHHELMIEAKLEVLKRKQKA